MLCPSVRQTVVFCLTFLVQKQAQISLQRQISFEGGGLIKKCSKYPENTLSFLEQINQRKT